MLYVSVLHIWILIIINSFAVAIEEEGGREGWLSILTLITLDYRQTNNNIIAALLNYQRWKKMTTTTARAAATKHVEYIHF